MKTESENLYEELMTWEKEDLADCIVDINKDVKKYRARIRLLESKISKLRLSIGRDG